MSTETTTTPLGAEEQAVELERIRQFLYREARFLDDREFEKWLDCYHPDAEFWMPAWADDDELTGERLVFTLAGFWFGIL